MEQKTKLPHILLITTDQQRGRDCTGIDGHSILETPHLDQLANEGVYFPKAYTPCPVCIPARVVIMTGQSPYRTGYFWNTTKTMTFTETLARILGRQGLSDAACRQGALFSASGADGIRQHDYQ